MLSRDIGLRVKGRRPSVMTSMSSKVRLLWTLASALLFQPALMGPTRLPTERVGRRSIHVSR